ncbi:sulfatase-like hydrolase/transferase [Kiritimatiellaeota bacterium B1221]|nr:sulfatase-like hydrolase/transferase [Kiritimatiellaeota bacterium B1221]
MSDSPNILFIITDQQRADTIHALGNPAIRTPALDRLVNEGTAFTNCYTPSPECVPARCCITHGQYPSQTRCYGNGSNFPEDRETYMTALSRKGYRTHGVGKYHFAYADHDRTYENNGFDQRERQEEIVRKPEKDEYLTFIRENYPEVTDPHGIRGDMYYMPQPSMLPQSAHPTQWVGDRAVKFIEEQKDSERPWFQYVSFVHPHPPFAPPSPWHKLYRDLDVPPPHRPEGFENNLIHINHFQNRYKRFDKGTDIHRERMMRAYYYASISFVDYQVGRILDALDEQGFTDNTLVLFTSDHGELLGDFGSVGKRSYHEPVCNVPLLLRGPGMVPGGNISTTPVSLIDITRTLLDTAGTGFDTHTAEGENLVDFANRDSKDRTVFTQLGSGGRAIYTAVTRRWKFVYSAPDNRELLFDLEQDPGESRDLCPYVIGRKRESDQALQSLRQELWQHLRDTGEAEQALSGDSWKVYPKQSVPEHPDAGLLYQDHPWASELESIPGYRA